MNRHVIFYKNARTVSTEDYDSMIAEYVHLIVASSSPTIVPNFFMSYCELKVAMRSTLSKYYLTLGFNPELVIPYRQLVYKYSHDKLESYGTHLTLHNDFKIRMKQVELLVDTE